LALKGRRLDNIIKIQNDSRLQLQSSKHRLLQISSTSCESCACSMKS